MKCAWAGEADQGGLAPYLKAINGDALLSAREERILAEAIALGDKSAFEKMIQANLRLVVKIAHDYLGRGLLLGDLIGEGNVGLVRAAAQFQPAFGTRFSTYASYWIKQSISQAVGKSTSIIRLPAHILALMGKWRKAERTLGRQLARVPSFDEVAVSLGLSEMQRSLITKAQQARQVKLGTRVVPESGQWPYADAAECTSPPELAIESLDDVRLMRSRMERLGGREQLVLTMRYGLDDGVPRTFREIGDRLGVTREWVRKIEQKAIRKLRGEETPKRNARWRRAEKIAADSEPSTRKDKPSRDSTKKQARLEVVPRGPARPLPTPISTPAMGALRIWQSQQPRNAGPNPWNYGPTATNA
jgi:RNA polymerase primary sigma factor